jgi:uncharacterized protein YndB with AHSA1/START domain
MNNDDLGRLEQRGDNWAVIFTRRFDHPVEKVWRAVTEPEHLAAWFPGRIEGELRAGAPLKFVVETGDAFEGEMVMFEPPKVLELLWGEDALRIELQPDGDGTVMTFVDTLQELGKAARDGAGWHECLARLVAHLDGTPRPPDGEVWNAVHPKYQEQFGPDASTIGPPEGHPYTND